MPRIEAYFIIVAHHAIHSFSLIGNSNREIVPSWFRIYPCIVSVSTVLVVVNDVLASAIDSK